MAEAIEPENLFAWQAFHHLRGSRNNGFSMGAIPFGAIADYCVWAGITCPVQKTRLAKFIITLDNAEREHHGRTTATA